jgi:hypothetical protein
MLTDDSYRADVIYDIQFIVAGLFRILQLFNCLGCVLYHYDCDCTSLHSNFHWEE